MGKKSAHRTSQPLVAVVPMGDVLEVLKAIADADAVKADIEQSWADSFEHWIAQQLRPKAGPETTTNNVGDTDPSTYDLKFTEDDPFLEPTPENATDASPDLNAIRDEFPRAQPNRVTAYVVQGTAPDVAEVLRSI